MPSRKVLFDTSVYISYQAVLHLHPAPDYSSLVVFQERIAGANDGKRIKLLINEIKHQHEAKRLLVPGIEEWTEAGKVLFNCLREQSLSNPLRKRPQLMGQRETILRITRHFPSDSPAK